MASNAVSSLAQRRRWSHFQDRTIDSFLFAPARPLSRLQHTTAAIQTFPMSFLSRRTTTSADGIRIPTSDSPTRSNDCQSIHLAPSHSSPAIPSSPPSHDGQAATRPRSACLDRLWTSLQGQASLNESPPIGGPKRGGSPGARLVPDRDGSPRASRLRVRRWDPLPSVPRWAKGRQL